MIKSIRKKTDKTVKSNKNNIENEMRKIIAKIARAKDTDIKNNVNLRSELGLDSLNAMALLAAIETKYGIQIDQAKAFDVVTARDLFDLVKTYLRKK